MSKVKCETRTGDCTRLGKPALQIQIVKTIVIKKDFLLPVVLRLGPFYYTDSSTSVRRRNLYVLRRPGGTAQEINILGKQSHDESTEHENKHRRSFKVGLRDDG